MSLPKIDWNEVVTKTTLSILIGVVSLGLYVGGVNAITQRETQQKEIHEIRSDVNTLMAYHELHVSKEAEKELPFTTKLWNWITMEDFREH